jgi:hypothetical protein
MNSPYLDYFSGNRSCARFRSLGKRLFPDFPAFAISAYGALGSRLAPSLRGSCSRHEAAEQGRQRERPVSRERTMACACATLRPLRDGLCTMALRHGSGSRHQGDWLSGRAPRSHRGGHWFDPSIAHKITSSCHPGIPEEPGKRGPVVAASPSRSTTQQPELPGPRFLIRKHFGPAPSQIRRSAS